MGGARRPRQRAFSRLNRPTRRKRHPGDRLSGSNTVFPGPRNRGYRRYLKVAGGRFEINERQVRKVEWDDLIRDLSRLRAIGLRPPPLAQILDGPQAAAEV